jgi:antibiotic biosynthesis monooxygenase (ABM) superfamily enzyme
MTKNYLRHSEIDPRIAMRPSPPGERLEAGTEKRNVMHTPSSVGMDPGNSVAFIITHTIKAGEEARYEAWLTEMLSAVSRAPGYLGREVFRPAQGMRTYTSIVRFDADDHLHAWSASETRHALVSRVSDLLTKGDVHEIRTGMDFWFTPEHATPPKAWRQFLLVLSAIYPLSRIVPSLFTPLFSVMPSLTHPLLRGLCIAAVVVGLMTFVVMPRYTRLVKRWLYEETESCA